MVEAITVRTVASILAGVDAEAIVTALGELYDKQDGEEYRETIARLRAMTPKPTVMGCRLARTFSLDEPPLPTVDVYGVRPGDALHYAIEFEPWAEWLMMDVHVEPPLELSDAEIIANILYEMTFCGFEESEITERIDEIKDAAEEAFAAIDKLNDEGSET
ncbi:DUF6557 family protein [Hyphomicrobium sp.]|uniref:DUF6557 family protein n=1 Tax=Hyphomicrobium sp. TaxID=82 RepID=UPI001D26A631|nr:DUF6557 family protein [Hyphomicrobium sp.]MBY0561475.1 hypothetical protein [Hyphomicrobium sp.]